MAMEHHSSSLTATTTSSHQVDPQNQKQPAVVLFPEEAHPLPPPPPPPKRVPFGASFKWFYAESGELYLDLNSYVGPDPQTLPVIVGQIQACPTKRTNNCYKVKWFYQQSNHAPVPSTLIPYL